MGKAVGNGSAEPLFVVTATAQGARYQEGVIHDGFEFGYRTHGRIAARAQLRIKPGQARGTSLCLIEESVCLFLRYCQPRLLLYSSIQP